MKKILLAALLALVVRQSCYAATTAPSASLEGTEWLTLSPRIFLSLILSTGYYGGYAWACFDNECDRSSIRYDTNSFWTIDENGNKIIQGKALPLLGIGYSKNWHGLVLPMIKVSDEFAPTCYSGWYTGDTAEKVYVDDFSDCPEEGLCRCGYNY